MIIPNLVPKTESQRDAPVFGRDYITEEETKNWVNPKMNVKLFVMISNNMIQMQFAHQL